MGGIAAPINEAVSLLSALEPAGLEKARGMFPGLQPELALGRRGGVEDGDDALNFDRARVMEQALGAGTRRAEEELAAIRKRMTLARRRRLVSQIATLVCSSGVLAALAVDDKMLTVMTAVLALLASLGTLVAEHQERLVKQGDGDIYDAYEKASGLAYKAGLMAENIRLLVKHKAEGGQIVTALEAANAVCEELNRWITKMAGSR